MSGSEKEALILEKSRFLFVLLVPYYEILFRLSTTRDLTPLSIVFSFTFSMGYSAVIGVFMRLSKHPAVNRAVTGVLLFAVPAVYLTEFFIFRAFKVFYDLDTIINGAGGVVTGFMGDIARLIFCFDGLSHIFVFLIPLLIYVFFLGRRDPAPRYRKRDIVYLAAVAVSMIFLTRQSIAADRRYEIIYSDEYSFQSAVDTLGFATGLRLDVRKMIVGEDEDAGFDLSEAYEGAYDVPAEDEAVLEPEGQYGAERPKYEEGGTESPISGGGAEAEGGEMPDAETLEEVSSDTEKTAPDDPAGPEGEGGSGEDGSDTAEFQEETDAPVEYGVNALDIDFAALAESASGTARDIDIYVASIKPSSKNEYTGMFKGKNLIFFTAEAFSGAVIDPELTPTLYRLATKGIQIDDYYQPAIAGTTGGEYANIFGLIPTRGGKSMKAMTAQNTWITIGNRLNDLGYYGKAFHNNSRTVYDRNITHNRLGYSDGFMGVGDGMEDFLSSSGFPASDLEMMQGTLPMYIDRQPFNVYYMTVSGHGQYGRSVNRLSAKNYDRVADLDHVEAVKCYIANNLELEDALTYTVEELEKAGIADDTVIVLGADHFPYSLDRGGAPGSMPELSDLYGYNVSTYLERDHNRLIIWCGCLEDEEPIVIDDPVFSLDILPTLCNLFGVDFDSRLLPGRDIFSDKEALIFNGGYDWKTSLGTYTAARNAFTPVSPDTEIPDDYVGRMKTEVSNRMKYCKSVISCDYFNHVFGEPEVPGG